MPQLPSILSQRYDIARMKRRYFHWIPLGAVLALGLLLYNKQVLHKTSDPLYNRIAALVFKESSKAQTLPLLPRIASSLGIGSGYATRYDMDFSQMDHWHHSSDAARLAEARTLLDPFSSTAYEYWAASRNTDLDTPMFTLNFKRLYEEDEDTALLVATRLAERDPDNAMNHYLKAFLLINLGELEAAQSA